MDHGSHRSSRYDPGRDRAWHLSILTGQGITACAVHDAADGTAVALFWGDGHGVLDDPQLPPHPASVSFVSLPEWSTLVPDGALAPGSEANHLALVHGGLPSGALRDEPVRSLGATCIYVHDDREEHAVLQRYPNARALPLQGLMVRTARSRGADRAVLLLHRAADRLDVAVVDRGRLLLSNSYPARSAHDVLYFTLLSLERTSLSPASVTLLIGGPHLSEAERDLLARYVEHCEAAVGGLIEDERSTPAPGPERWMAALEQFECV